MPLQRARLDVPAPAGEEASARELLKNLKSGVRPLPSGLLDPLLPRIQRSVSAIVNRWGGRSDVDEIVQEVVKRLLESPPTTPREGERTGLATLLAWVKTTTFRLLVDNARRSRRDSPPGSPEPTEMPDASANPEEEASTLAMLKAARKALAERYSVGLPVLEALLAAPGATVREIASTLDLTEDNVHQIRTRTRRVVVDALRDKMTTPRSRGRR